MVTVKYQVVLWENNQYIFHVSPTGRCFLVSADWLIDLVYLIARLNRTIIAIIVIKFGIGSFGSSNEMNSLGKKKSVLFKIMEF